MASSTSRRSNSLLFARILMGSGLILIGVVSYFLLKSASANAQEFSAIPAKVNYPAPQLELTDLNGNNVALTDYLGKVVLVNMWATWCPPCKAEMPALQAFYDEHKDDGFVIVGINDGDAPELVGAFVRDYGLTFPIWLDEKYLSESAFNTINLPSSYVIDRNGTIQWMWLGAIRKSALEKYVTPVIER